MEFREMYEILQAIEAKDLGPAIRYDPLFMVYVGRLMCQVGQMRNDNN